MDNTELFNIKERYEKIYILADESTHKLLSTMKEDILTLINAVEQPTQSYGFDTKSYLIGRFDNNPREWQELTDDDIEMLRRYAIGNDWQATYASILHAENLLKEKNHV